MCVISFIIILIRRYQQHAFIKRIYPYAIIYMPIGKQHPSTRKSYKKKKIIWNHIVIAMFAYETVSPFLLRNFAIFNVCRQNTGKRATGETKSQSIATMPPEAACYATMNAWKNNRLGRYPFRQFAIVIVTLRISMWTYAIRHRGGPCQGEPTLRQKKNKIELN